MKSRVYPGLMLAFAVTLTVFVVRAQQKPKNDNQSMSGMAGMSDEEMNKRGDRVMGFDHTKTTHHFRLLSDGGAIEITANTGEDTESRDQIRMHLGHIAKMFAAGNFNAPMLIHDQTPPGVPVMKKLKDQINYSFEETERGASIRISTKNEEALQAIYAFLRFQINEHKTGDSLEISKHLMPSCSRDLLDSTQLAFASILPKRCITLDCATELATKADLECLLSSGGTPVLVSLNPKKSGRSKFTCGMNVSGCVGGEVVSN